jgi:hypothetical protein
MRVSSLFILVLMMACGENFVEPTAVPAGISDPAWASVGKSCSPDSPIYRVPPSERGNLPEFTHGPRPGTIDDEWSDLARTVPGGFAGFIFESSTLVVYLVDTTMKQKAFDALRGAFPSGGYTSARARAARWIFFQLAEWYRFFQVGLRTTATITFSDIDEAANRITFGVLNAASRAALEQSLTQLGIPCYLVGIRIAGFSTF